MTRHAVDANVTLHVASAMLAIALPIQQHANSRVVARYALQRHAETRRVAADAARQRTKRRHRAPLTPHSNAPVANAADARRMSAAASPRTRVR
jgi:hypothetical protein